MWLERTSTLIGEESLLKLITSRVAVFGLGGVGSYAAESLARAGIGAIDVVDGDIYSETNLNRQLFATISTIGAGKADAAKARIMSINPDCDVTACGLYFNEDTKDRFEFSRYDYVVDAIDSVNQKVLLIKLCKDSGVKIISSLGAANRLRPESFRVTDIYKTSVDPLAKVLRQKLRKAGIKNLKTVCSIEEPVKPVVGGALGSLSCVTAAAGLVLAGEVIRDLISGPRNVLQPLKQRVT